MLEARELTKTYDGFTALDALTLKVEPGDVYLPQAPVESDRHITAIPIFVCACNSSLTLSPREW